jgi:ABC-type polysaccharide/polyol phosphate transport system ATPase subunit
VNVAIAAAGLTKRYRRQAAGFRLRTLKSALLGGGLTEGLRPDETIQALRDVSFEVGRGEAFGVVGGNGSGKSTLLKLVAGLLRPDAGTVRVDGRVAALIELGAGFHPEISGRENVFINGALLGLSRREVQRRFDSIVEFSGLEGFLEEPVKNYSSGMYVRLGFAVAIHTDPEILLVDEVLSVGDEAFGHKCRRKIEEHLERGGTLLVVSHALDLIEDLCHRALWLDRGVGRLIGEPRPVIDAYRAAVAEEEGREHRRALEQAEATEPSTVSGEPAPAEPTAESAERPSRWGSRLAEIERVRLLVAGVERYDLVTGDAVAFELDAVAHEPLEDFVFGVGIFTARGIECWGSNTDFDGLEPRRFAGRATVRLCCPSLRLAPGEYEVDVAVHTRDGAAYDYRRRFFRFTVRSAERGAGIYLPEHCWEAQGEVDWREPKDAATRGE